MRDYMYSNSLLKSTQSKPCFLKYNTNFILFSQMCYTMVLYTVRGIIIGGLKMKNIVLNFRKIHRILTIPIVILMILKFVLNDSDYGVIVTKVVSMGMMFMAVSGLFMYTYTNMMKKKKQLHHN